MTGSHGAGGQRAAENTKSTFAKVGDAIESARQNTNSYADTMISGHSHRDTNNNYHTNEIKQHGGTGIHPDARKAGEEVSKAAGAATGKVEHFIGDHRKKKGDEIRRGE